MDVIDICGIGNGCNGKVLVCCRNFEIGWRNNFGLIIFGIIG